MSKPSISVELTVEDVLKISPKWSRVKAETFLKVNQTKIKSLLIAASNEALDHIIEEEMGEDLDDWDW